MAFKKSTVASAKVAATLTNYPTYIDLSRVGITTLAEAQSVRIYSDESKTTELAREIVSVSECHCKIPSLTTTTVIYVDYDGVRADYAVTDTYGRNAVWADYLIVYHMDSVASSLAVNSAGGTNGNLSFTDGGVAFPTLTSSGRVENGFDFGAHTAKRGVNTQFDNPYKTAGSNTTPRYTESIWVNTTTTNQWGSITERDGDSGFGEGMRWTTAAKINWRMRAGTSIISIANYANTGWVYTGLVRSTASGGFGYVNNGTNKQVPNVPDGSQNFASDNDKMFIGIISRATAILPLHGLADEYRFRNSAVTEAWLDTEYNNQSDEAGFWGTWIDAGGGGGGNNQAGYLAWL